MIKLQALFLAVFIFHFAFLLILQAAGSHLLPQKKHRNKDGRLKYSVIEKNNKKRRLSTVMNIHYAKLFGFSTASFRSYTVEETREYAKKILKKNKGLADLESSWAPYSKMAKQLKQVKQHRASNPDLSGGLETQISKDDDSVYSQTFDIKAAAEVAERYKNSLPKIYKKYENIGGILSAYVFCIAAVNGEGGLLAESYNVLNLVFKKDKFRQDLANLYKAANDKVDISHFDRSLLLTVSAIGMELEKYISEDGTTGEYLIDPIYGVLVALNTCLVE